MSAHEYYVFKVLIGHNWAGFYWIFVQRDIQKVGSDIGDNLPQAATVWWYFTSAAPAAFICVFAAFFFYFTANCGHSELTRLKTITLFPFWLHWFCVLLAGNLLRHLGNKHVVVVLIDMIYFLLSLSAPLAGVCVWGCAGHWDAGVTVNNSSV